MSTLIPTMSIAEFKRLKASDIRDLKSVEVTSDGEYLFTAIIPHGDMHSTEYAKANAEELGLRTNITGGKDPAGEVANASV